MSDAVKLTPALRSMLSRIVALGPLLEITITACGGSEVRKLNRLFKAGWVRRVPHPTVIDRRWGEPADALEATDAGRAALKGGAHGLPLPADLIKEARHGR